MPPASEAPSTQASTTDHSSRSPAVLQPVGRGSGNDSSKTSSEASIGRERSRDHTHQTETTAAASLSRLELGNSFNQQNLTVGTLPVNTRESPILSVPLGSGGNQGSQEVLGIGVAPSKPSHISIGQRDYPGSGNQHQLPFSSGTDQRDVMGLGFGRDGTTAGRLPGNEVEDVNDSVFSPTSMDDERMMILEKVCDVCVVYV